MCVGIVNREVGRAVGRRVYNSGKRNFEFYGGEACPARLSESTAAAR